VPGATTPGTRSVASNAFETFALRGSIFALGVLVNIAVSRTLGPEGRGQYALATLGALTIVALGKLGLEHANVYLLGTVRIAPGRLASQNLGAALAAGLVGALVLLLAPLLFPTLFGNLPVGNLALAASTIPFLLHIQLAAGLQNLTGLITWQFRAAIVGAMVQLLLVAGLAFAGSLDVTTALAAYLATTIVVWLLIVSRSPGRFRFAFDVDLLRTSLRYALIVHVGLVLLFFQTRVTLYFVQALVGTSGLGYYSLAVSIAESVLLAGDSVAIALLPRQTQARLQESASVGLRAAVAGALLVLAAGAPLLVFGPEIISFVFGAQFAPSHGPLVALLPGMVFLAVQRFCGVPALRANRPARIVAIYAAGVAMNVLLAVWSIPQWGLVGAAASTSASYLLTAGLFVWWASSLARVRPVGQPAVSPMTEGRG
jgi:O-antigen/teichoic acid export membrane protein